MWRLTDEERELRERIRTVVLEQIRPRVREMDENCDYSHDIHETLARENLMGLALPAEYGGRDASEVSWCAYVEELAKISGTVSLMAAEGAGGISAFVVDGKSPGLSAEPLRTMGMPGWKLGAPRFEDVEVPHANLLGREGDGFKIAMMTLDRSRPTVAAQAVGVGQGAIDLALDYAARRETMGEPLLAHQGLQFKLAGMEADVAAARALTFQAATFVAEGDPSMTKLSAMAKLVASDLGIGLGGRRVLSGNGTRPQRPFLPPAGGTIKAEGTGRRDGPLLAALGDGGGLL